jgi:5'-nucleotidase/UDP-sugar diphosphatase
MIHRIAMAPIPPTPRFPRIPRAPWPVPAQPRVRRAIRRTTSLARVLLSAALIVPASLPASAGGKRQGLVIVHTNDSHSHLLPEPAPWRDDHPVVGGVVALESFVRTQRLRWERVLVLDAGDILTGTPLSELKLGGVEGGVVVDLLDRVGYDAGTIGNHEFDHGAATLDRLIARTHHRRLLCANLFHSDGSPYAPEPGHVFTLGGMRVGVVGLVTEDLPRLLNSEALKSLRVTSAAAAAQQWIASLQPRPDLLVALTHLGVDADEELARAVPDLDVIVGGHSHTRLTKPRHVGKTMIVQTGGDLREAGLVRLEFEDGHVVSADAELVTLFSTNIRQDQKLLELTNQYDRQIKGEYGVKIAELETPWHREHARDSSVGNWLCDELADAESADFGMLNSGGIRKNIEPGPITRLDVVELLPFANEVVTFEVTGAELRQVLEHNVGLAKEEDKGVLQLGHITSRWRRTARGIELVDPTVRGAPLDPARTYSGASVDFVVYSQAETYMGLVPRNRQRTGRLISAVIEERLRKAGRVRSVADGRLLEVKVGTE